MHYLRLTSSYLLMFLVLFNLLLSSSGLNTVKGFGSDGVVNPIVHSLHEKDVGGAVRYKINRKVLAELDASLDYDYAGANPKHDPRGRRTGGNGKNP